MLDLFLEQMYPVAHAPPIDFEPKRREFLAWLIDKRDEWGREALGFEFEGDLW